MMPYSESSSASITKSLAFQGDGQCKGNGAGKGFDASNPLATKIQHYQGRKKLSINPACMFFFSIKNWKLIFKLYEDVC